jgi:hypothetical protein
MQASSELVKSDDIYFTRLQDVKLGEKIKVSAKHLKEIPFIA